MPYHLVEIVSTLKQPQSSHHALHVALNNVEQVKTVHEMVADADTKDDIFVSSHILSFDDDGSLAALIQTDPFFSQFEFTENVDFFINHWLQ